MNRQTFDTLTRALAGLGHRRQLFHGLAGVGVAWLPAIAAARKKRKRKKRKDKTPKPNEYGCLDVGQPCGGDDSACCSGSCEGVKPKKGKPDRSRCVAHDTGICTPGSNACTFEGVGQCHPGNADCYCYRTTGSAAFCGATGDLGELALLCRDCRQDTDCQEEFGPGAACVDLGDGLCEPVCPETGGTACMPACPDIVT